MMGIDIAVPPDHAVGWGLGVQDNHWGLVLPGSSGVREVTQQDR